MARRPPGIVTDPGTPHNYSTYQNHGCRCDICVGTNRLYNRRRRQERFAERELIGGRLVAVNAPAHGKATTYSNYGCRCEPCTSAATIAGRERTVKKRAVREQCTRCGHSSGGCERCGRLDEILGSAINGEPYCHTYTAGRTCYQQASHEHTMRIAAEQIERWRGALSLLADR